jgi:hypothetical protein
MRILQLIVSGTLANAGRPERVKNKQNKTINTEQFSSLKHCLWTTTLVTTGKTVDPFKAI